MSTPTARDTGLILDGVAAFDDAAMADQAPRIPPKTFLLVKYGKTGYTKGDVRGEYEFGPEDADKVLAEFSQRQRDIVIDWEHQCLKDGKAPAAGWIDSLTKTAEGLVANVRYWVKDAREALEQGAYRYFSPVLSMSKKHPVSLHSVGLTNHPATHGIPALVTTDTPAADTLALAMPRPGSTETRDEFLQRFMGDASMVADFPDEKQRYAVAIKSWEQKEFSDVEHLNQIAESIGVPVALADGKPDPATTLTAVQKRIAEMKAAAEAQAEFLKLHDCADLGAVTGKIKGMVPAADLTALNDRLALIDAEKAVAAAFSARKLTEAQREWAMDYAKSNPAGFAAFVEKAPQAVPAPAATVQLADGEDTTLALTDEALGRKFDATPSLSAEGFSRASYIAFRKAEAAGRVKFANTIKTDKE